MSNIGFKIGDTIKLRGVSATKIWINDYMLGYGYVMSNEAPTEIIIADYLGKAIIDSKGGQHNMLPEHDDDFNVIVLDELD